MGIRRKARECALQILYQLDMGAGDIRGAMFDYWKDSDAAGDVRRFAEEIVEGVVNNREAIDESIAKNSTNWKLSRMAAVDKNILRMAVYELTYRSDIPVKVTINEAVEIAKRYGTSDSGAFVNGVLDNIAKGVDEPEGKEEEVSGNA